MSETNQPRVRCMRTEPLATQSVSRGLSQEGEAFVIIEWVRFV